MHSQAPIDPIGPKEAIARRIRIASWPHWYAGNPYLNRLYSALSEFGVVHVPGLEFSSRVLLNAEIDVFHLHWPEELWRRVGATRLESLQQVARVATTIFNMRRLGIRVVWTVHNLEHHEGAFRSDRVAYEALHRIVDLRLFLSQSALGAGVSAYPFGSARLVCYHGNVEGEYQALRSSEQVRGALGLSPSARVLLGFGQIRHYKGFELAVAAMRELGSPYHLVLAGGSSDESYAERLRLSTVGLQNVTLVPHYIDAHCLGDLLRASDAIILPYSQVTGSSALLTALTAGRGVIVSDLPHFREILSIEPLAAEYLTERTPNAFTGAVHNFFQSGWERRGRAAKRVAGRFEWCNVVRPFADWLLAHHR